jgi:hypothetical protein
MTSSSICRSSAEVPLDEVAIQVAIEVAVEVGLMNGKLIRWLPQSSRCCT